VPVTRQSGGRVRGTPRATLDGPRYPRQMSPEAISMRHVPPFLFVLTLVGLIVPVATRADVPEPDQAFLDEAIPPLRASTQKTTGGPQNIAGAMSGVRELLVERRKVLAELGEKHKLNNLTGIATQDEYDAEVMTSLRKIVQLGAASDTTHPSSVAVQPIEGRLASLPSLGKQPIPFMVLGYSEMAIATGDSMVAQGTSAQLVDHVVLSHIAAATDLAIKEGEDFFGDSAARSLRQELVLARLRCPKDQATYKMNAMKNQIKEDGGISTLYYMQCSKCGDPRVIEFPQELASRLNRMSEQQKQAKPGTPARSQVVEP